ncbi:hypothetical protein EJ076_34985 [Mesorhizobium sp. M7D.F.Ca.US.005.01.1.1]|nr:hypothetical protein EJ076_00030 [Mesorhizobium sp. M7D.F.Ca.US.005.01.1.1]AZO45922.1 hypothetical protein EJ076_34985 [Mesorhizobium sp. M7D.F.Ca.US.005.01.1.1]
MSDRFVDTEQARQMLILFIQAQKLPFTATLAPGKHRTTAQNRLQRKWMTEIAEQMPDEKAEYWRGYCKLRFGVPMLRAENEEFRAKYDAVVKPLSYEQKIAIMSEPLDLPVTRIMTTKQKTAYLDEIFRHFSEQGVILTIPDDPSLIGQPERRKVA